jgi:fumarate hydratase class II
LAQNTMMPAGKTSMGLNPMAWAADYSNKQGGDQLSALAQQLLSGASGGAPVGTGPQTEEDYQKMLAGLSGQGAK